MTDGSKQVSVAELLARNGQQVDAAAGGRRRRGSHGSGSVTVASLTGELPVVNAEPIADRPTEPEPPQPVVREETYPEDSYRQAESAPRTTRAQRRAAQERARAFESLLDPPAVEPDSTGAGKGRHGTPTGSFDFTGLFAAASSVEESEPDTVRDVSPSRADDFGLGEFGFDDAGPDGPPTEIRLPEIAEPEKEVEATTVWPMLRKAARRRSSTTDNAQPVVAKHGGRANSMSAPSPAVGPANGTPANMPLPGRGTVPEFPTEVWTTSTPPPPRLLSNQAVAEELLPPESQPRPQPMPDDNPTDVDHPFFRHRIDEDEIARRDAEHEADQAEIKRQWTVLGMQSVVAAVVGVFLFWGFERLWAILPWVALPLAIAVMLSLVAVVRILRRGDDVISLAIALAVGVFVTLGPLPFVLSTA